MTHFMVGVIVHADVSKHEHEAILGEVDAALAPFNENLEVEEREIGCWDCGGGGEVDGGDTCGQCDGTGKIPSTYNPDSKWDWYTIGGRFDGAASKTGKHLIHEKIGQPSDMGNNVCPVSELHKDFCPCALLTPDGRWIERGDVGWWGTLSNDKGEGAWKKEVDEVLAGYRGCVVVGVDCHI